MKHGVSVIISFFLCFTTFAELNYIEIEKIQNAPIIAVSYFEDFETIINKNKVSTAYLHKSSDSLLIIAENTYFSFSMNGYFTLTDYKAGNSLNFKDGTDFNEAKILGFSNDLNLYNFYKRNEFKSTDDCRDAYTNGFDLIEKEPKRNFKESFSYYQAKELGYKKYSEYQEYLDFTEKGFKSKNDMQLAISQGFPVPKEFMPKEYSKNDFRFNPAKQKAATDFYKAQENGFPNCEEYTNANELNLTTYAELEKYREITKSCDKISESKNIERKDSLVYYLIQNLPKSEMSISILTKTLQKNFDGYEESLRRALNKYTTTPKTKVETKITSSQKNQKKSVRQKNPSQQNTITPFITDEDLKAFFKNIDITSIGSYSEQSEIFKKK